MRNYMEDKEFNDIVEDIVKNDEFNKLKEYKHHGDNRLDHCIRVSYSSYKKAKKLKLDYNSAARAGLLHDFFFVNNQKITLKERLKVLVNHPKIALENSKKIVNLNKKEENIIVSHMFPIGFTLPKCKESILVNLVDDAFSIKERVLSTVKIFSKKERLKKQKKENTI